MLMIAAWHIMNCPFCIHILIKCQFPIVILTILVQIMKHKILLQIWESMYLNIVGLQNNDVNLKIITPCSNFSYELYLF